MKQSLTPEAKGEQKSVLGFVSKVELDIRDAFARYPKLADLLKRQWAE